MTDEYRSEVSSPARSQWSDHTHPYTGTVYLHTPESVMDDVGPDTGAERVASFIWSRPDPGAYHDIVDSDSDVLLIHPRKAAYHIAERGADGTNLRHGSFSVSMATSAHMWGENVDWDYRTVKRAAKRVAVYLFWLHDNYGLDPYASCRWLDYGQAQNREPGICLHGVAQPVDRSDAWRDNPTRRNLEIRFMVVLLAELDARFGVPFLEEDDMLIIKTTGGKYLWSPYTIHKLNEDDAKAFRDAGIKETGVVSAELQKRIVADTNAVRAALPE